MHLLVSSILFVGALILGLALLAVLRARNVDPVSKLAAVFTPTVAPAAGTP